MILFYGTIQHSWYQIALSWNGFFYTSSDACNTFNHLFIHANIYRCSFVIEFELLAHYNLVCFPNQSNNDDNVEQTHQMRKSEY